MEKLIDKCVSDKGIRLHPCNARHSGDGGLLTAGTTQWAVHISHGRAGAAPRRGGSAPAGTRTLTEQILSLLPLPLGYWGRPACPAYRGRTGLLHRGTDDERRRPRKGGRRRSSVQAVSDRCQPGVRPWPSLLLPALPASAAGSAARCPSSAAGSPLRGTGAAGSAGPRAERGRGRRGSSCSS
jgi:hypothetical protein